MPDIDIRKKFSTNYSSQQVEVLNRALDYATKMHEGQKRESGEPYITHPIAVANILIDLGLDYSAVSAALLHDCVEDTTATDEDIKRNFGDEIAELVLGVTKTFFKICGGGTGGKFQANVFCHCKRYPRFDN